MGQRAKVEAAVAAVRGEFSGGAASDLLGPHGARFGKQLRCRLTAWGYCR